jgi:hypothetical protein
MNVKRQPQDEIGTPKCNISAVYVGVQAPKIRREKKKKESNRRYQCSVSETETAISNKQ